MIKTIIRKFLGIDFTPRKQLYAELNECYAEISRLLVSVDNERALRFNAEGNVLELEEQIKQLQCYIEELKNHDEPDCDEECEPDCDEGADPNPNDEPDCDEGESVETGEDESKE